jgi:hypothetical protein
LIGQNAFEKRGNSSCELFGLFVKGKVPRVQSDEIIIGFAEDVPEVKNFVKFPG